MTTAHRAVGTQQRIACQSEVTDGIQHLMTDELHRAAQAFPIEDVVVTDGNRVVQRCAERQAGLPELLYVAHETKCPRDGQLVAKNARIDIEGQSLATNDGSVELDLDVQVESGMRAQLTDALAFLDADRPQNLDVLAGLRQLTDADLIDRLNERRGAAVHDRHFLAVDLDVAVVDRKTT